MTDDVLADTITLLTADWNNANTNSRTPVFEEAFDIKRFDTFLSDYVIIWELENFPQDNASGALSKKTETIIMLEVRTSKSRAQAVAVRKELMRILNAVQIDVFSDGAYDISDVTENRDFSDKLINMWHFKIKWKLQQLNVTL